jgi:hypothetical protein
MAVSSLGQDQSEWQIEWWLRSRVLTAVVRGF